LREGPAQDWLEKLRDLGPFDFVFIDADKTGYPMYLAWAVDNLRLGGVVMAHNALREGRVLSPESDDDRSIRAFNQALASDSRLDSMILAVGDGMAVGVRKA
jgi:predicted O-methyltransferase YrrM